MHMLKRILQLFAAVAISWLAGALGSIATVSNIPTWYAALEKPPLLPPNEVFGPVWSVLYTAMGVALFLVFISKKAGGKQQAYIAFGVQLLLNTAWSFVFFALHVPWAALVVIALLIAAIIWTMRAFAPFSKPAVWLFVPYLAWVCFATYLTFGVALLN